MKLLVIHGRAQQGFDPAELETQWQSALVKGLAKKNLTLPEKLEIVFPFYGDELDRLVRQIDAPTITEIIARGGAKDTRELEFRAELYMEMIKGLGIPEGEIDAHFDGKPQERGVLNWRWVQAILRVLDRTPLGDHAIDRFTRDVFVYLTYPAVRKTIDKIVAEKLGDGQWVVVGHSLGSVVGYNVLCAANAQATQVTRYVTVGSPLGIRPIRDRLEAPLRMPPCVKSWYNAFDPRDVVALYPLDANSFNIKPPIRNNNTVDNFTDNRHGISGYFDDANVAEQILGR